MGFSGIPCGGLELVRGGESLISAFCPGHEAGSPSQTPAQGPQPARYLTLNLSHPSMFSLCGVCSRGPDLWTLRESQGLALSRGHGRLWVSSPPAGHGQPPVVHLSTVSPGERARSGAAVCFCPALPEPWREATLPGGVGRCSPELSPRACPLPRLPSPTPPQPSPASSFFLQSPIRFRGHRGTSWVVTVKE